MSKFNIDENIIIDEELLYSANIFTVLTYKQQFFIILYFRQRDIKRSHSVNPKSVTGTLSLTQ